MFVRQAFGAFQFHQQNVFDEEIRKVFPYALALVDNREGSLRDHLETTDTQFLEQRPVADLFKEPRAQRVGDLEDGPKHTLGQQV
jgi:hypothetical protein